LIVNEHQPDKRDKNITGIGYFAPQLLIKNMKKWLAGLLLILILTVSAIYIFTPSKIIISSISSARGNIFGEFRTITQEDKWEKWWRDENEKPHSAGEPFMYSGSSFHLVKYSYHVAGIEISQRGLKLQSILRLISFRMDSTAVVWQCEIPMGMNPLTRIRHYNDASEIKEKMDAIMKNFSSFVSKPENVYGMAIIRVSTVDTMMLSSRFTSAAYPTTSQLYSYFDEVEKNIQKQKGRVVAYPIMNVRKLENDSFETEVAIPTNHRLNNDGKFIFQRMIPGNFMTGEVKGGAYTANEALKQLELFIADYNRAKIANAFQSMVTNRLKEPDTSKWITKVYIPVVQ
jgi:hypothetical protein